MKNLIFVILIGISNHTFSQTIEDIDSVSIVMCDYLKELDIENDTLKISSLYEKQLFPYLEKVDQSKSKQIGEKVFYRLQRNCVEFRNLLDRLEPPKEAAVRITKNPTSTISKNQLKEFKNQKNFYYFEVDGDTTKVSMNEGIWKDKFSNETYSKLTYNWVTDTEFELTFIDSNNKTRSNFSVKGDKYIYKVLSKQDNYYLMSLNIPGQKTFEKFKLYYKKTMPNNG
ncbi:hypothetical protein [Salegentibacter chungangensis]|uniref:DUF4919 domain-containing protein n=1 Tax=Salegentibacter chungangensis TaxID=1335724 RepID=A0ABW3NR10_9FLAO